MGGRGSDSGFTKYSGLSIGSLESMLNRQKAIVAQNRVHASFDPNDKSAVIRRKGNAARKAIANADAEIAQIEKALERAKRNKKSQDIPF